MDLRHLRYFVVLAEELHVTRAAERLGIRQPPLSIQIKQVEREVGAPLFRRLSRGVELTEIGSTFLIDARRVLTLMEQALTTAQSRARGQIGALRVGFGGATYLPPEVPAAILRYREHYPDVALTPIQSNTPALIAALQSGETDVAFIRPPCDLGPDLRLEPFLVEEMVAVLPTHHRLGGRRPGPARLHHRGMPPGRVQPAPGAGSVADRVRRPDGLGRVRRVRRAPLGDDAGRTGRLLLPPEGQDAHRADQLRMAQG